jgi:GDP-4-dehydro-6-deoxy-D-mannose reductase
VLVTGAAGFAGGHLLPLLGDRAVAGEADVTSAEDVRDELTAHRPAAVVHLAALSSVGSSWDAAAEVWRINAVGTVNVLDAVTAAADRTRVLVVSTGEVYGDTGAEPADEERPLAPLSPYAASKAAAEVACERARRADRLDVVVARAFSHTGPGQDERFAVGSWARQVARLERHGGGSVAVGDLGAERDVLDVRDVCAAYVALLRPEVPSGVYNVASSRPVRMADVLDLIVRDARCPVEVRHDPARSRPADIRRLSGDASRLRAATGWAPGIPLERTLGDAVEDARRAEAEASAEVAAS